MKAKNSNLSIAQGSTTRLTFLGTGTSHGVPVMTCNCAVCTSTDARDKRFRSSVMVEKGDTRIVVDVGPDFRMQMLREKVDMVDAVLLTHEHRDHIAGIDDIRVYNYRKKGPMTFYCESRVEEDVRQAFQYIFDDKAYPGLPSIQFNTIGEDAFTVGDLEILPIPVLHYHLPVMGFRFGNMAYITDVSDIPVDTWPKLEGLDHLVLGCLRRKPHISHYHLEEAIRVAERIGAGETHFIHMSHDIGLHAEVEKELPKGMHLSYDGLQLESAD